MSKHNSSLKWYASRGLTLKRSKLTEINSQEILVKIHSCGICGSDIKILKFGNPRLSSGRIMGHEIAGEVVEVGSDVKKFNAGDKISIGADIPNHGKDLAFGHELDGGFSEYMLINKNYLQIGPIEKFDSINFDIASLAEPLACCINGYEKVNFKSHSSVLILGAGTIGVMLSFLAKIYKIPKIFVADIAKIRIKNLKKFDFITKCFDLSEENIYDWKKNNHPFDLIFTANNNPKSQQQAVNLIESKSIINFFGGLPKNDSGVKINTNNIHYKEAIITGSHGSSPEQHKKALRIIENYPSFFKSLISKRFGLKDFRKAIKEASNPENFKIMIKPNL
tara:strand:+ start:567 stop:1574 length:1008 start_codon:yes stop_codon:yes gene_type:complete